jgi:hypothetical protein
MLALCPTEALPAQLASQAGTLLLGFAKAAMGRGVGKQLGLTPLRGCLWARVLAEERDASMAGAWAQRAQAAEAASLARHLHQYACLAGSSVLVLFDQLSYHEQASPQGQRLLKRLPATVQDLLSPLELLGDVCIAAAQGAWAGGSQAEHSGAGSGSSGSACTGASQAELALSYAQVQELQLPELLVQHLAVPMPEEIRHQLAHACLRLMALPVSLGTASAERAAQLYAPALASELQVTGASVLC